MRLGLGLGVKNSTFVGGYDPAAAAFLAATGITSKTESDAINDLVVRLKGYGLWGKMKAIYPFVSDTVNLLSYTGDLTNAVWSKNSITATSTTITETSANALHYTDQTPFTTGQLGNTFTASIEAKPNGRNWIVFGFANESKYVFFDVQNGVIGNNVGGVTATITSSSNGFYKCTISATMTQAQGGMFVCLTTANGVFSAYAGDITKGIYLQNMQFQSGSSATTYQPIATTPANRFVSQFKYNLKDPRDLDTAFRLSFNGTWAYSKQGATGNGVNNFINTYYNPNTYGQLNSAHLSVYNRTSLGLGGTLVLMGAKIGANIQSLTPKAGSESWDSMNGTDSNIAGFVYSAVDSLVLVNRTNSADFQSWFAGVKLKTTTQASVAKPDGNVYISGRNQGYAAYPEANQKAFSTIGDGLTDQEASNLYTSIQIYQQDLSRAVGTPIVKVSDLSAQSYVAATQIQNTVYATAVDVFVKGMKAVGLWEKMKAVYPFVSDNINQFGYTEDFTYNPMWGQNRCTMASNVTTAPDGTTTADSFTTTSTTIECMLRTSISSPYNNVTQTTSVYAKKSTANYFRIRNLSSGGDAWFNLTNGTIGSVLGGQTATMTSVGNGWYRCTLTGTKGVSATDLYDIGFTDANETRYPTASVVGYLWGAQLELGSTATTYIPVASTVANKFVQQFKYNLMSPLDADTSYRLAFNGSWNLGLTGATPNGANAYANTYLNMASVLTNNNNHMSFYSRTNSLGGLPANYKFEMGVTDNTTHSNQIGPNYNGTNALYENGSTIVSIANANTTGMYIGSTISSTSGKLYKNNAILGESTTLNTYALFSNNIYLSATNVSSTNTPTYYSNREKSFTSIGDGLTDNEAANLYTLTQGLQTTLNRQV